MVWGLNAKQKKIIERLYPPEKRKEAEKNIVKRIIAGMGAVIAVFLILGIINAFAGTSLDKHFLDAFRLIRPSYGEGDQELALEISSKEIGKTLMNIDILERVYDKNTIKQGFAEAWNYINKVYLGENTDKNKIIGSLVLPEQIPNTSIHVAWELDQEGIILKDGSIQWEKLQEKDCSVQIFGILQYGEWEERQAFTLLIVPEAISAKERFLNEWKKSYMDLQTKTSNEEYLSLPQNIAGQSVYYQEAKEKNGIIFLILGVLGVCLVPFQVQRSLEIKEKYRKKQIQIDYPNIVNKFVLLLGAGMTINGAWSRITVGYMKEKNKVIHYAYEEMLYTVKAIQNGVSEVKAYEDYGRRMEQLEYLKLSTLISQNLRKGNKRLLELLEYEAMDAFEKRKEFAKMRGEEAGTKLLFPMILMLILVMFLIIIPAFLSF